MLRLGIKSGIFCLLILQLLASCTDDEMKNVSAVSAKKITFNKDRYYDFEIVYSDSAKVKAKGFAPILDQVTPSSGTKFNEMPKGVKITFFDDLLNSNGTIRSDYAINKTFDKITIFKKNVVVVTKDITFTTEELTWDENKRMYFSPYGTVTGKDGSVATGSEFSAPQDFSSYKIKSATAQTYINGDLTQ
jgi:hypothetical protein